jgi:uncharacterized protein (TIGR02147 family)
MDQNKIKNNRKRSEKLLIASENNMTVPSIYDFQDYRLFLKMAFEEMKKTKSLRAIAKDLGFASHSSIVLVINAERNLSPSSASKIAEHFEMSKDETKFFQALVAFNHAQNAEEKLLYQRQMFSVKGFLKAKPIGSAQYQYFSNLLLVIVREVIGLTGGDCSAKAVLEYLGHANVSEKEIEMALDQLVTLRMVDKSVEGKMFKRDDHIELPKGLSNTFIYSFHKMILEKSLEALVQLPSSQREYSATVLTFNSERTQEAKEFLSQFRNEFIARFADDKNCDSVTQFSFQHFELAKAKKKSA